MDFLLSDDLREYREVLQRFFAASVVASELRATFAAKNKKLSDAQIASWNSLVELGALAASVPEEQDGLGFGITANLLAVEASAKYLYPLPFAETLIFGLLPIELLSSKASKKELLPQIAEGSLRVSGSFASASKTQELIAKKTENNYLLSGKVDFLPSVHWTNALILKAQVSGETHLFLVREEKASKASMQIKELATFDRVRPYFSVAFDQHPATLLSEKVLEIEALELLRAKQALLLVAELSGVAEKLCSMSNEYASTRKQFSKPLSSFQAVSHKLADMHSLASQVAALARFSAWSADEDQSQFGNSILAAKGYASEVVPQISEQALQVHGGIGFTQEHDLHLYLRRSLMNSNLCGSSDSEYQSLGAQLLEAR